MSLPEIVSPAEWRAARVALLEEEKALTKARDALNTTRRELPMVKVEQDYRFTGPDGEATLVDLFEGRDQLLVGHFMFDPEWDDGCPSCTAGAEEVSDGLREHLATRDTTLAYVSRAPSRRSRTTSSARAGPSPGTARSAAASTTTSTSRSTPTIPTPSTTTAPWPSGSSVTRPGRAGRVSSRA